MDEKPKQKRDWKKYEAELKKRSIKKMNFLFRRPTKKQLDRELKRMNRGKQGRVFRIPESVIGFSLFIKTSFDITDRDLAIFLKKTFGKDIEVEELDHSSIVKRRKYLKFEVPFDLTREKLEGKTVYFDGVCMRVGRGGNYRSKKYGTDVKYLKIGVFTDEKGKVVDFVIGDEHDAEVNMIREKMPKIKKAHPKTFVCDGAGSAKDIVVGLKLSGIEPVIRAAAPVVEAASAAPPPNQCMRRKRIDTQIWEDYARRQEDHAKWNEETEYPMRWVFSEGRFSALKRMFGEEIVCRTQKTMHDEMCAKFMIMDGKLPDFWS
jgi:hypothetical protein